MDDHHNPVQEIRFCLNALDQLEPTTSKGLKLHFTIDSLRHSREFTHTIKQLHLNRFPIFEQFVKHPIECATGSVSIHYDHVVPARRYLSLRTTAPPTVTEPIDG